MFCGDPVSGRHVSVARFVVSPRHLLTTGVVCVMHVVVALDDNGEVNTSTLVPSNCNPQGSIHSAIDITTVSLDSFLQFLSKGHDTFSLYISRFLPHLWPYFLE